MAQDYWLPGFNFKVEEWFATGLTYETLAICRSLELARAALAAAIAEKPAGWFMIRSRTGVVQENVRRLRRELEDGEEGTRQDMMLRLLVEEENKVGLTYEQLDEVRRQIGHIEQIISTQLDTIAMLKAAGHSVERAERSLANAQRILIAHEAYRAKIEPRKEP
jgi:hypothetical protein